MPGRGRERTRAGARARTLGVLLVACSTAGEPAARATDVEPYVEAFERFERWTHRTLSASVEMRDANAQREALFAPLGLDANVVGARVVVDGSPYELRDAVDGEWVRVQVEGREIEAARTDTGVGVARTTRVTHHEVRVEMWFADPEAP